MSSIQTYTNRKFFPLAPKAEDVNLLDIAHALGMKVRYTGHVRYFYSVGQHALLVSWLIYKMTGDPYLAFQGLHHDDTEAWLPDVATPIKDDIPGFRAIENRLHGVVAEAIGLPHQFDPIVKKADIILRTAEQHALMPPRPSSIAKFAACPWAKTVKIKRMGDRKAKRLFLKEHYRLLKKIRALEEAPKRGNVLVCMFKKLIGANYA